MPYKIIIQTETGGMINPDLRNGYCQSIASQLEKSDVALVPNGAGVMAIPTDECHTPIVMTAGNDAATSIRDLRNKIEGLERQVERAMVFSVIVSTLLACAITLLITNG